MRSDRLPRSPLVSTAWLEEHLDDPGIRVLEVCDTDDDTRYREGHIPGADWWYWKDLCWHPTDRQCVTPALLAERLGGIGIGSEDTVVLSGDCVQFGTYAFWTLTMAGHRSLRLLDGARVKWLSERRPLSTDTPLRRPVPHRPGEGNCSMRVGRADVLAGLGRPGRMLLDLRTPEEYQALRVAPLPGLDHGAERWGRIPGAVHLYFRDLLEANDSFKPTEELGRIFSAVGATPDLEIVTYCRLSHRATLAWVALEFLLGYPEVKIYDGSWTEWGSIVGFPVER